MRILLAALCLSLIATSAAATCPSDATAPAAVTTLHVDLTGHRTFTVEWLSTGDDGSSGDPATYEIRTSPCPLTELNWGNATLHSVSTAAPNGQENCAAFTISSGSCQQALYVAVFCIDEAGNRSAISNVVAGSWWCGAPYTMVECYGY
jgi:hypothetical protein